MPPENEEVVEGAVADEEGAVEEAEGAAAEGGADAKEAQVDEEDPMRAEAQAEANAQGVDGEVTDEVLASARKVADEILSNSVIEDVVGIEVVE